MPDQFAFPGSSYLASGTYDPATRELRVRFVQGGLTVHSNVPQQIVDGLKSGGGSYYRRVLYGNFGAVNL